MVDVTVMGRRFQCTHAYPTSPIFADWIWGWRMFLLAKSAVGSRGLGKGFYFAGMWVRYSFMVLNRYPFSIDGSTSVTWRNPTYGSNIQLSSWLAVGGTKWSVTMSLGSPWRSRSTGPSGASDGGTRNTSMRTSYPKFLFQVSHWRRSTDDDRTEMARGSR